MRWITKRAITFLASAAMLLLAVAGTARAQSPSGVATHMGTLHDGATFLIEVPANCNRTLFLYNHGYVVPGSSNPAEDSLRSGWIRAAARAASTNKKRNKELLCLSFRASARETS
jgi:hypothetical protein